MMSSRKLMTLALLLSGCLAMGDALAAAQQRKVGAPRVRFRRGASSATVSGTLSSRVLERSFLVGAKAGQELTIQIKAQTSDGLDFVNVMLYDPSGKPAASSEGSALKARLKQSGDYRIEVSPPGSFYRENVTGYKKGQFSLLVNIQ
jgi:hypothetical protein